MRTRQQLFDSKSRDFKSAAIKGVQTPQVQEWLGLSRAPPSEARRQLLAWVIARSKEQAERQARVDTLIRARNAPKRRGLLYFRLTAPSTKKRGISKEEQAALNLAGEERAARKARVDHLMKLRMPTTLRNLTSLSRSTLKTLRPLLYRRIVVANCGQTLVQSLASNKELPPMVHSILFLPSALAIEGPMWERVLHELTNLTQLGISGHTRLTRGGLNDISFKLLSFISFSNCPPVWADLLQLQLRLEVLEIRGDLLGPTPLLPALRSACLDPAVAAKMLERNCLPDIEFFLHNLTDQSISVRDLMRFSVARPGLQRLRLRCTQFFCLVDNVPTLLKELYSLVFDSDPSWVRTSIQEPLAYTLHSTAVRLLAIDLPQLRKCDKIEKSILSNYCRPPAPIQSVHSISSWEDLTMLIYQDSNNIFNTCIFSGLMPFRLVRKTHIRDGKPVNRVHLATVEQEIIPRQPEMDWYTRRLNTQRARRLQRLEDLCLARPYERPGPETPRDEDWRLSMQSLADFAKEMVAEQEQGWQDAFQRIADWHIENFQPPPIPRIGTEVYFEFGPLVNGRHDFPWPHGIGNLQYGERYNVFS
ncbi:hypothetical protein C8J57DRAFT_1259273 [Mycena rebaudengoi]|nr:hypothetical protein C8J57DRAFT_1259273 [Mycena rebaudengoi]